MCCVCAIVIHEHLQAHGTDTWTQHITERICYIGHHFYIIHMRQARLRQHTCAHACECVHTRVSTYVQTHSHPLTHHLSHSLTPARAPTHTHKPHRQTHTHTHTHKHTHTRARAHTRTKPFKIRPRISRRGHWQAQMPMPPTEIRQQ